VDIAMARRDNVGLGIGVSVGSGVFVAGGTARTVWVYYTAIVFATWVKIAFISSVGAAASGEPLHALRTSVKTTRMRISGECDFRIILFLSGIFYVCSSSVTDWLHYYILFECYRGIIKDIGRLITCLEISFE
jgi:hypothetical protein